MQHEPIKCLFCGKEFTPEHQLRLYCSDNCAYEARLIRNREIKRAERKKRGQIICKCGVCGKEFETDTLLRKYCVGECSVKGRALKLKESNNAKPEFRKKQKAKKHKKQFVSIVTVNEQARSQRLSYGQLVAREWMGVRG